MRIAYLDCFSGISGDMFLGALVDAGVPFELLQQTVAGLHVGATLEMSRLDRNGISATKIDVVVNGRKDLPREEFWAAERAASHAHGEQHSHSHSRHLPEILKIVGAAPISEDARKRLAPSSPPWEKPRQRSTTFRSRRCTSTKSARRMRS